MTELPVALVGYAAIQIHTWSGLGLHRLWTGRQRAYIKALRNYSRRKNHLTKKLTFKERSGSIRLMGLSFFINQGSSLRKRYLQLLLAHPLSEETKDAENYLWMHTSYMFIAAFKQRIAALDRAMSHTARQNNQTGQGQNRSANNHTVEHRKLLQRFRQFLSDEERFWSQLVIRMQRSYMLDEARPALISLGILSATNDGQTIENVAVPAANNRNQLQFPSEDLASHVEPRSAEDRQKRLVVLSKALICLGDIARYKEQYNESQGRSKIGRDDVPGSSKRGKNRKSGPNGSESIRPRNFARAKLCYDQARLLVPDQGNPSNQLAIISAYEKDPFASLVHYYRALCVSEPFETAAENMSSVLTRTYDQWKRNHTPRVALDTNAPAHKRMHALTEKIVILHAICGFALERSVV
jgi:protein SMG7